MLSSTSLSIISAISGSWVTRSCNPLLAPRKVGTPYKVDVNGFTSKPPSLIFCKLNNDLSSSFFAVSKTGLPSFITGLPNISFLGLPTFGFLTNLCVNLNGKRASIPIFPKFIGASAAFAKTSLVALPAGVFIN